MQSINSNGMMTIDQLLGQWRSYAAMHSVMHNEGRGHFKAISYCLMVPSIVLASTSALGTIGIATKEPDGATRTWFLISMGIVSIASTCLLSVHRFMNVSEQQVQHGLYADLYESFANEVDMQQVLDDDPMSRMFVSKQEFLKYCKSRMDVLIDKAPPIPKSILEKNTELVSIRVASVRDLA